VSGAPDCSVKPNPDKNPAAMRCPPRQSVAPDGAAPAGDLRPFAFAARDLKDAGALLAEPGA
jgi:hypothetical protein